VPRLAVRDIEFLLRLLPMRKALRNRLEEIRTNADKLTDDEADELRDLCGERLQTHGFGPEYEATEEGKTLERLIDELFVG
jgi:hypothetical protein